MKTVKTPKVTFGVPVYNGATHLPQALDSLLAQTFTDFEIIISDNASTDETMQICRAYQERDNRIRYHRHGVNIGLIRNFNGVVHMSEAPYFCWLCVDDYVTPDMAEKSVAVLESDPGAVLCQSNVGFFGPEGIYTIDPATGLVPIGRSGQKLKPFSKNLAEQTDPCERFREILFGWETLYALALMRRDALIKTSIHRDLVGSDDVLSAELSLLGRFRTIDEPLMFKGFFDTSSFFMPTEIKEAYNRSEGTKKKRFMSYTLNYLDVVARSPGLTPWQRLKCIGTIVEKGARGLMRWNPGVEGRVAKGLDEVHVAI